MEMASLIVSQSCVIYFIFIMPFKYTLIWVDCFTWIFHQQIIDSREPVMERVRGPYKEKQEHDSSLTEKSELNLSG